MLGVDLKRSDVMIRPDPSRTVIRPFDVGYPDGYHSGESRTQQIVDRILGLDEVELCHELNGITDSLDERHRDVETMIAARFREVAKGLRDADQVSPEQARLIGAYFSEEYSYEAAALFNPSAVLYDDQTGAPEGGVRFVMSLRGIGEGHVSSVTFRTGGWVPGGDVTVDAPSQTAVPPRIEKEHQINGRSVTTLHCEGSREISETVIFPILPSQRQGVEDMRLCRFTEDDGSVSHLATYTAFNGSSARSELLRAHDFNLFDMEQLTGDATASKGMALFPRRIGGGYAMLGRQDNENIWLLRSDHVSHWEGGEIIIRPNYPWEFVQMGNCGSPIEIDEGWLVLTHGVGTVRNYCMGAALLDKDDPSKLLARTPEPLLAPGKSDRDGYVPNVVYSCGGMVHDGWLLIPYGVADNFATFASCRVSDLVGKMV